MRVVAPIKPVRRARDLRTVIDTALERAETALATRDATDCRNTDLLRLVKYLREAVEADEAHVKSSGYGWLTQDGLTGVEMDEDEFNAFFAWRRGIQGVAE